MKIPPGLFDPSGKASASWVSIYAVDGENETELREFGPKINGEGDNTSCYVLAAPGDILRVKYSLYGGEAEFLDLVVDGILRDSLVNSHIKTEPKKGYAGAFDWALYQVKNGPRASALQQWQMVVQHRTNGKETISNDDNPSSKVSSISVQIYRKDKDVPDEETDNSTDSDTHAPIENALERAPSYVKYRQWSDMNDSLVFSGPPPSFKVGFQNGKKATPKAKERVTKRYQANDYKLWVTFTFNLRSTSDLTTLGFENVPVRVAALPRSIIKNDDSPSATSTPTKKHAPKASKSNENDESSEEDSDVESAVEQTKDISKPKPKPKSKAKAKAKVTDSSKMTSVEEAVNEVTPKRKAKKEQSASSSKSGQVKKASSQLSPVFKNSVDNAGIKKIPETAISEKVTGPVEPESDDQASTEQTVIFAPVDSRAVKSSGSLTPMLLGLKSAPARRAGEQRGLTEELEEGDEDAQIDLDSPLIVETPTNNKIVTLETLSEEEITNNVATSDTPISSNGTPVDLVSASSTQETIDYRSTAHDGENRKLSNDKSTSSGVTTPESTQKYIALKSGNEFTHGRHEVPKMNLSQSRKIRNESSDSTPHPSIEFRSPGVRYAALGPHHIGGLPDPYRTSEMSTISDMLYGADISREAKEGSPGSDASTEVADISDVEASVRDSKKLHLEFAANDATTTKNAQQQLDDMSTQSTNGSIDTPSHTKTSPVLGPVSFSLERDLPDFVPEFSPTKQKSAAKPRTKLPSSVPGGLSRRNSMASMSPAIITKMDDTFSALSSNLPTNSQHTSTTYKASTFALAPTPASAEKRKANAISGGILDFNKSESSRKSSISPAKKNTHEVTNGSPSEKMVGVEFEKKAKEQIEKSARGFQERVEAAKSKHEELRLKLDVANEFQKEKERIHALKVEAEELEHQNNAIEAQLAVIYGVENDG